MAARSKYEVGGRTLSLSQPEKALSSGTTLTRANVVEHYLAIAEWLLPHLRDRALALRRYPNGVPGAFFQKRCAPHSPPWRKTPGAPPSNADRKVDYCFVDDAPSLVWAANLAGLELRTSLALQARPDCPTALVFDLIPAPPAGLVQCAKVAVWLREELAACSLNGFPLVSGAQELQIHVPLNGAATFPETLAFARQIAGEMAEAHPAVIVDDAKSDREGRVFLDSSLNDPRRAALSPYSLRIRPQPAFATPLAWREVEDCLRKSDPQRLSFTSADILARLGKQGDLFEPLLRLKQRLPAAPHACAAGL